VPGAPDQPKIGKVTKSTVDLSWIRPLKDGGAPLLGYIVEKRRIADGADWEECNAKPVKVDEFKSFCFSVF